MAKLKWVINISILSLLCSCATIVHRKTCTLIIIVNPRGSKIIFKDSTYYSQATIKVKRSRESLKVTAIHDTIKKEYIIKSSPSGAFLYGNLGWNYLAPFAYGVDLFSPKRFYYGTIVLNLLDTTTIIRPRISRFYYHIGIGFKNAFKQPFAKSELTSNKNQIKFTLARPIAYATYPGFELSYQRYHTHRWATQVSGMYIKDIFNAIYINHNNGGYRVGLEEKYFVNKNIKFKPYLSIYGDYAKMHYDFLERFDSTYINGVYDSLHRHGGYFDTLHASKRISTINLKYGFEWSIKHFVVDISVGIGCRYKQANITGKKNPNDSPHRGNDINIDLRDWKSVKGYLINIPISVKIGYMF